MGKKIGSGAFLSAGADQSESDVFAPLAKPLKSSGLYLVKSLHCTIVDKSQQRREKTLFLLPISWQQPEP